MITRRKLLMGACAALLPIAGIPTAEAHDRILIEDLLYGVSDALIRSYIRNHYDGGYWDSGYWWRDGRRYSVIEYRNYLIDGYWRERRFREYGHRPPHPPQHRPPPPPHHRPPPRADFGHRPPPPKHSAGHRPPPPPRHAPPPPRHAPPRIDHRGPGGHRPPPPRH